ncbi:trigger factor [Phaeovibrio sulfidiphilus]|uniref:Trigger factor n=1 Tax=Phaeovibrio sulfidiphilus TaxID=1220600 RepID=A0A8J6YNZ9_9PROT|nr:trigger factor [Phaeovibrio sulfidiphilus]MBE1236896.1 trigger factor [Phaeovibrio sulfidiphilus]
MQLTETLNDSLKREFTVSLSAEEVKERIDARLDTLKDQVRLPGFRPGKIPMSLMRKRYAKGALGEIADAVVKEALDDLTDKQGLRPATQPKLDVEGELSETGPMTLKISFEILPEIPEPDFSSISLEREVITIDETTIDETLEEMRSYAKEFENAGADAAAENGSVVEIDFIGRIDGEAFENGSANGHDLELGSGQFIPGFEEQLIGAKAGDKRDVTVSFPEDYPAPTLAGKEAVFEVTVHAVKKAVLPELDDALAKTMGADTLDALKEQIRTRLRADYDKIAFDRLKPRLLDALAPLVDFPVPESMLEIEFSTIWREIETALKNDTLDDEDKGKSEDELRAEYREIAIRRMRLGLLLAETGRRNNITISRQEMNELLQRELRNFPGQEQLVLDYYRNNPNAVDHLRAPLFEDKACQYILEKAKVTDKPITMAELRAEIEGASAETEDKPKKTRARKKKADEAASE